MDHIGFLYNCSMRTDPLERLSPSLLNRVVLIDACLRERGDSRLFFYSPKHIDGRSSDVPGYLYENGRFVPTRAPVPRVNGNWTYRTRRLLKQGLGLDGLQDWAAGNGVGIYVPHAFSELANNKLETYKVVNSYHETLHPYCERFRNSIRQLEHFVELGRLTFIKPRTGNKGSRIFALRRGKNGIRVTFYEKGKRRRLAARRLPDALDEIRALVGRKRYVIQHGIDTLLHEGSVFDIRVVMINDGEQWAWLHEIRRSPKGSEVSNVRQGGESLETEHMLFEIFGADGTEEMLRDLKNESFGLATYLERLHPGDIFEMAFDFVIDLEGRLRLLEINTKPGLVDLGSEVHFHARTREQELQFEKHVYPHTRALASFLLGKLDSQAP